MAGNVLAKLIVKLIADVGEFTTAMDTAAKKAAQTGEQMRKIGDAMTLGVTAPILAAGTAAIKYASDLNETRNKTDVVFGGMSSTVRKFGETASRTMGMSENAALSYAGTYGAILKNMGLTESQTAEMSLALTQLTADYASFHNLSPGEAFEKIKAGLVGSSEPLIALGKDLRVAAVESYALANGITQAGQKMTPAQLAMARFGLLMSQSKDEMGDFSRTADGLANSARTFSASWEDALASFGEVALPVATDFMQAMIPVLQWFRDLPTPVKNSIVYLLTFAAALGPVMSAGGRLLGVFSGVAKLFGAKGALTGGITLLKGALTGAAPALTALKGALAAAAGPAIALGAAIAVLIMAVKVLGPAAWESAKMLGQIFVLLVKMAIDRLSQLPGEIRNWMQRAWQTIVQWKNNFIQAGRDLIDGLVRGVVEAAQRLIDAVTNAVQGAINKAKALLGIHSPSRIFEQFGRMMMLGLEQGVEQFSRRPILATVNATARIPAAVSQVGMGAGGARRIEIGEIRIYGDLSDSQMRRIREEMRRMSETTLLEALS